jgi:hypothetical protein
MEHLLNSYLLCTDLNGGDKLRNSSIAALLGGQVKTEKHF